MSKIPEDILNQLILAQRSELTEHHIYKGLAKVQKIEENKKVLNRIADEELKHYEFWEKISNVKLKPNKFKILCFFWISRIFGLTFGIRLMEKGETEAQINYTELMKYYPNCKHILDDEKRHEQELIDMLQEKKLEYMGSVVLGLNDALVELSGALAGFSLAFQNTRLIAIIGLITGIAASLSMAASEYLSNRADENENALTASMYTGVAYVLTVACLVTPFFVLNNYIYALATSLFISVLIIFVFNYYLSIAKNLNFKQRFFEMTAISLGVSLISFFIGYFMRSYFGIDL